MLSDYVLAITALAREIAASNDPRWRRFAQNPLSLDGPGVVDDRRPLSQLKLDLLERLMARPARQPLVTFGGVGLELEDTLAQSRIDAKNQKLRAYRKTHADEYWLLIVASDGLGGYLDFTGLEGYSFRSDFARTLILESFTKRCVDITKSFELGLTTVEAETEVRILRA